MIRLLRVENNIDNYNKSNILPAIVKCLEDDFIPNSTYFSNGVCVINNQSSCSYVYVDNKIKRIFKFERLFLPINNIIVSKNISEFNYQTEETDIFIKNIINNYFNEKNMTLIGVDGQSYVYQMSLMHKYDKFIIVGPDKYQKNATFNMDPYEIKYKSINTLQDLKIFDKFDKFDKFDIIIENLLDDNIITFLKINKLFINKLCIIGNQDIIVPKLDKLNKIFDKITQNTIMDNNNCIHIITI